MLLRKYLSYLLYLFLLFILTGCYLAKPVVKKPKGKQHAEQNKTIEKSLLKIAGTGDWLVIRGYHAVDDLVSNVTGTPISHVGIYDAQAGLVIEAEGQGIHTTRLVDFIDKSHRLLVIRPRWRNDQNSQAAIENARNLVGKNYDFLGTIGFNFPDRYYCSELAIHIYKEWHSKKERFPRVIKPGDLYLYGRILYDSRPRDEM